MRYDSQKRKEYYFDSEKIFDPEEIISDDMD